MILIASLPSGPHPENPSSVRPEKKQAQKTKRRRTKKNRCPLCMQLSFVRLRKTNGSKKKRDGWAATSEKCLLGKSSRLFWSGLVAHLGSVHKFIRSFVRRKNRSRKTKRCRTKNKSTFVFLVRSADGKLTIKFTFPYVVNEVYEVDEFYVVYEVHEVYDVHAAS